MIVKSFEEKLQRLEQINEQIRKGEIALQDATALFEEGIKLAGELDKELNAVEGRIEKLVAVPEKEGEAPVLELFPELKTRE